MGILYRLGVEIQSLIVTLSLSIQNLIVIVENLEHKGEKRIYV